ncbi:unnamed protein product [Protopolystoma xenopodis]|uniref:Uncharacterized protein n=1 Tax=Protopolystoma xenopodis TaxID=117903 RepID=A0A448WEI0_9PLAT|nr:unnamed protein product [Protopolystoma xenopodis]
MGDHDLLQSSHFTVDRLHNQFWQSWHFQCLKWSVNPASFSCVAVCTRCRATTSLHHLQEVNHVLVGTHNRVSQLVPSRLMLGCRAHLTLSAEAIATPASVEIIHFRLISLYPSASYATHRNF